MTRQKANAGETAEQTGRKPPSRSFGRRLAGVGMIVGASATIAFLAGFVVFTSVLPRTAAPVARPADAIVVLTGGPKRLTAGLLLLKKGMGTRLLITGVHKDTGFGDIRDALMGDLAQTSMQELECCIDLDKAARDTVGNARETARWVRSRGYDSLIIVTASYHMPRSLIEFRRAMPNVTLTAYPVFPDSVPLNEWWQRRGTTTLLVREYMKFLYSLSGIRN